MWPDQGSRSWTARLMRRSSSSARGRSSRATAASRRLESRTICAGGRAKSTCWRTRIRSFIHRKTRRKDRPSPTCVVSMTTGFQPRRDRIFERDAYRCVYCNAVNQACDLTLDHVEPRVKGGDHSDGNLVTCCAKCNELKAGEAAWSFLARNPELRTNFLANAAHVWPRIRRAIEEAARKTR